MVFGLVFFHTARFFDPFDSNLNNNLLQYWPEAILSFSLFHQSMIMVTAFYVVQ